MIVALPVIFVIFISICIMSNIHKTVIDAYVNIKKLNGYANSLGVSKKELIVKAIKLCLSIMYYTIHQFLNRSLVKIGPNSYVLTYTVNGRIYKQHIRPKLGPYPVIQVINDKDEDVTNEVRPFMGPKFNWNNDTPPFKMFKQNNSPPLMERVKKQLMKKNK